MLLAQFTLFFFLKNISLWNLFQTKICVFCVWLPKICFTFILRTVFVKKWYFTPRRSSYNRGFYQQAQVVSVSIIKFIWLQTWKSRGKPQVACVSHFITCSCTLQWVQCCSNHTADSTKVAINLTTCHIWYNLNKNCK